MIRKTLLYSYIYEFAYNNKLNKTYMASDIFKTKPKNTAIFFKFSQNKTINFYSMGI